MTGSRNGYRSVVAAVLGLLCAAFSPIGSNDPEPIANPPLRRAFSTDHYTIRTNLDPDIADDLAKRMDAMYEEYSRRFVDFRPVNEMPRLEVYLFKGQKDYQRFAGDRLGLQNTGGIYIPRRNLLGAFLEGQGRDGLRRTLQHEAFHQFAYNAISPNMPVWLNEGMAQMFEEAIWTGDGFWLGQAPPRRIRQLQQDLKKSRLEHFESFIRLTPEEWAKNLHGDPERGATQYNQAWAMVYFLAHAKDENGEERYRTRLLKLLRLLNEGKDGHAAFIAAFSANFQGFQDRFNEYASELRATDEATIMERAGVLGDLLGELARKGKKFKDLPHFKRTAIAGGYRMHYTKGSLQWDSEPDVKVYVSDIKGRALTPDELYFDHRPGAPLPDIVCRPTPAYQFRTRFYKNGEKYEHETRLELLPQR